MIVRLISDQGKVASFRVKQVVVQLDDGTPVALSYQEGRRIIHTSANDRDFPEMVRELGIQAKPVEPSRDP